MSEAYIIDAIRTPRGKGKKDGSLYEVKPITLLTTLLNELQQRHQLDTSKVDDIVLGCVTPIGDQGGDIAKTAAIAAGWNDDVAGVQINRFCASGLEAVNMAAMKVRSGWEDLVVAGGVESMSRIPMGSDGGPWALDPETNLKSSFVPQGVGADLIATLDGYSREDVDNFAVKSQQKAAAAQANGYFDQSVVPVKDHAGVVILEKDEFIKGNTTLEGLAKLNPSFEMMGQMGFDAVALQKYPEAQKVNHVHHAGNSSGIVDGAALVLLASEKAVKEQNLKPRAKVLATALVGTDPTIMLTGPAPAARKALEKAGLTIDDIDLFEVNEAFAAVVMRFINELNVPAEKVNVNGGAIALGHPLGATGAMILGTLLDELVGFILATGSFLLLSAAIPEQAFMQWGWRIPFIASAVLVIVGLYIRLKLHETPAFQKVLDKQKEVSIPFKEVVTKHTGKLILGTIAAICTFVVFYLTTVFALNWGTTKLGYARGEFLELQLFATLCFAAFIPLSAIFAEKFGRKATSIGVCIAAAIFGLFFSSMLESGNTLIVFLFLCTGLAIMGLTYGPIGTVLSEIFPTSVRYTGSALTFNLAGIFGASFAPLIATKLAETYGLYAVGYYLTAASLLSLIAFLLIRETKNVDVNNQI
ncbi:acetyl-CoA C-acetyltransferase [Acinetobacter baumannii]|nr:acetyl-CoA C-acetyltransferase [Acinetobacter baumannii]EKU0561713.1 acetyl-CoA C-acetyltransferase [Acinetobacter baumannii]EKW2950679.1 acetyl-CoA C-acetyltransferase [Acinetobacter baumannii]EKW7198700.1 acetyl-CoA C-acetyltransferase [Acinetobacter baumannii]ELA8459985.1 acetyl-CoA C-acetyltransferase [Acinetobacter baumannii]